MTGRSKEHTPKSQVEKSNYLSYIKQKGYEPTKEEGLPFDQTYKDREDFSPGGTDKPNRLNPFELFKRHIESNWIYWVVSGFGLLLFFLGYTARIDLNSHEINIKSNSGDIEKINKNIEDVKDAEHNQDLQIQENKIRLEYSQKENKDTIKKPK